jgi:hypothetical protein
LQEKRVDGDIIVLGYSADIIDQTRDLENVESAQVAFSSWIVVISMD